MKMKKSYAGERGFLLFQALIILVVLSILLATAGQLIRLYTLRNRVREDTLQAAANAESGLEDILYRLKTTPWLRFDGSDTYPALNVEFGKNKYKVEGDYIRQPDIIEINSSGYFKKSRKNVKVLIEIDSMKLFQIISKKEIQIGRDVSILGDIYAGERFESKNFSIIKGSILSGGYISIDGEHTGNSYPGMQKKKEFNKLFFKELLPEKRVEFIDDILVKRKFSNVILYHRGPLHIEDCDFKNTSLFIEGNLEFTGYLHITAPPLSPSIMSTGNIRMHLDPVKESQITGWIISDKKTTIEGNIKIEGKVISREIRLAGKITMVPMLDKKASPPVKTEINYLH